MSLMTKPYFRICKNNNLTLCGTGPNGAPYIKALEDLKPGMSRINWACLYIQWGFVCSSLFLFRERFYSLRSGLTFPAKVAKALRSGEFPNKKWNQRSAKRIVWVATRKIHPSKPYAVIPDLKLLPWKRFFCLK